MPYRGGAGIPCLSVSRDIGAGKEVMGNCFTQSLMEAAESMRESWKGATRHLTY